MHEIPCNLKKPNEKFSCCNDWLDKEAENCIWNWYDVGIKFSCESKRGKPKNFHPSLFCTSPNQFTRFQIIDYWRGLNTMISCCLKNDFLLYSAKQVDQINISQLVRRCWLLVWRSWKKLQIFLFVCWFTSHDKKPENHEWELNSNKVYQIYQNHRDQTVSKQKHFLILLSYC